MSETDALTCIQQAHELDAINAAEDAYTSATAQGASAEVLVSKRASINAMCDRFNLNHGRHPVLRYGTWA